MRKTNNNNGPMTFRAGQTVRFQMIDWVSEKVFEFEATATGNFTVIPEREDGQFTRIKDAWIEGGYVMVLPLRRDA